MTRKTLSPLVALATIFVLSSSACTSREPGPSIDPRPVGECRLYTISTGDRVCLMTEPQGPAMQRDLATRSDGLVVEALGDPTAPGPLPSRVNLREQYLDGCLQVRNQGECGWCVGHSAGAALDALYCAEGCPPPRVSMAHLWSNGHGGTIGDCGPGWQVADGLAAVTTTALVPESEWPYTNGGRGMTSTRPSNAELMRSGRYRATGHTMIADDANKVDNIRRALASGRTVSVWSGVCFGQGWSNGTGTIPAPMLPCGPMNADGTQQQYDGYHAYTIVGYDDATGEYLALNSWGTGWGDGGYMRLSAGFMQNEVSGGGYLADIDRSAGGCEMPDAGMIDAGSRDAGPPSDGGPRPDSGVDAGPPADPRVVDRCAAIADCNRCSVTSGCMSCDGRCVAANATRTGAADGSACGTSATSPEQCAAPMGACAMHADCGACAMDASCAWCGSRNVCVGWPADAAACSSGDRVATRSDQCNDVTGSCATAMTCEACQMLDGCGWCNSSARSIHAVGSEPCVGGGATHADRAACEGDYYGRVGMCPMPDAGMPDAGPLEDAGPMSGDAGPMPGNDAGACSAAQDSCSATRMCCGSLVCNGGSCCGLPSSSCRTGNDCCPGIECVSGRCACRAMGASCRQTVDCCGSTVCRGGTCQRP
ncbi:MAG: C1 family peptidase [Deltaproteobacteria bacterium]|nr:C1 family peptidase [Deltaproteobacteria bacterium]